MSKHPDFRIFSLSPQVFADAAAGFHIRFDRVETPVGPAYLAESGNRLVGLYLTTDLARVESCLEQEWRGARISATCSAAQSLLDLALAPRNARADLLLKGTPFQLSVWKQLCKIPRGSTCSYQELADRIEQPQAVRAVANAVGANPVALVVPCHRVIRSTGELGGYASGPEIKRQILAWEGVAPYNRRP